MKKLGVVIALIFLMFSFSACGVDYSEMEGTYKMISIEGEKLTYDKFSYCELRLYKDGKYLLEYKLVTDKEPIEEEKYFTKSGEESGTFSLNEDNTAIVFAGKVISGDATIKTRRFSTMVIIDEIPFTVLFLRAANV